MMEYLNDLPWYSYRLVALGLLLASALYYQLAHRRRTSIDYTICVSFFLGGAMLAVQPQAEEAGNFWSTGFWVAEALCLAVGVVFVAASFIPPLSRRLRSSTAMPVLKISRPVREKVGVGAASSSVLDTERITVSLVPLEYRYSRNGFSVLGWKPLARPDASPPETQEIKVPMSMN